MSKIFTLYRGILYTVIVAYLLAAIAPMIFGYQPYIVLSASMEPTIMTGALSYIDKKDTDVCAGDIVAFTEGKDVTVIHRITKDNGDGTYTTKGDNNENEDFVTLPKENIVGTVDYSIPKLGYVTSWLQSKKGLIVAGGAIVIAFISSFLTDESEEREKKRKKNKGEKTSEPEASGGDAPAKAEEFTETSLDFLNDLNNDSKS